MSTGKATIRGRNCTSASERKVSTYSPQYKQTAAKKLKASTAKKSKSRRR